MHLSHGYLRWKWHRKDDDYRDKVLRHTVEQTGPIAQLPVELILAVAGHCGPLEVLSLRLSARMFAQTLETISATDHGVVREYEALMRWDAYLHKAAAEDSQGLTGHSKKALCSHCLKQQPVDLFSQSMISRTAAARACRGMEGNLHLMTSPQAYHDLLVRRKSPLSGLIEEKVRAELDGKNVNILPRCPTITDFDSAATLISSYPSCSVTNDKLPRPKNIKSALRQLATAGSPCPHMGFADSGTLDAYRLTSHFIASETANYFLDLMALWNLIFIKKHRCLHRGCQTFYVFSREGVRKRCASSPPRSKSEMQVSLIVVRIFGDSITGHKWLAQLQYP